MSGVMQRRWVRICLAAGLGAILACGLCVGIAAWWVRTHDVPRHEHFGKPRSAIAREQRERDPLAQAEAVELTLRDGFVVRLGVVRDHGHDAPRPVMIVLGGHRTGRDAARLVGDPGAFAVVAVDYPYDGPDRIRGVRQVARHAPGIRQALLDAPRALLQALDWVVEQPWADPERIELVGVSLGAPFAAVAGALDERFCRVWLVQGAADNRAWLEQNLRRRIASDSLRRGAAGILHRLAHGASLDTGEWVGRVSPRPVVVIGALDDRNLPRHLVEDLHAAAGEPRELVWVEGGHVSPRRPETVRRILEVVRARM